MARDPSIPTESADRARLASTGLHKIALAIRHNQWAQGHPSGLTPTQGQILARLLAHPGICPTDLAHDLALTPATVSGAVSALADKGLIERVADEADARKTRIALTPKGRRAAQSVSSWPDFLADAVADLPSGDQSALLRSLMGLIRALQARERIPVQRMCVTCTHFRPNAHPGTDAPHHCAYVDAPLTDGTLRLECPDHEPLPEHQADAVWRRFISVTHHIPERSQT